MQTTLMETN